MKKLLMGVGLCLLGAYAQAQGLEGIVVEKYYISNAADAAGSVGTLPAGSVTYRIYVDMLPGYKFQMAYGDATRNLKLTTTTSFFNNEDRGAKTPPSVTLAQAGANTVMLDSWVSCGEAFNGAANKMGVLKSEDTDGTITHALLQNNNPAAGIPLTSEDGMIDGTGEDVSFIGVSTEFDILNATSQQGNSIILTGGSWYTLNGASGPTSTNRVLIAQITTDGIFHYELNIQIGTPTPGVSENYVVSNPTGSEQTIPSLKGTYGTPNVLPTIVINTPVTGATPKTGNIVHITSTATDLWGTDSLPGSISSVKFYDGATLLGTVANPGPYNYDWTAGAVGAHSLTAVATDNEGGQTTSATVFLNVLPNVLPTISIVTDSIGHANQGAVVTITSTQNDADGTIDHVDYLINGSVVGTKTGSPWTYVWNTTNAGTYTLTARAVDNDNGSTMSSPLLFNVIDTSAAVYHVLPTTGPCSENSFLIPVARVKDTLVNCIGFDAVMTFDKYKVVPTGIVVLHGSLIDSTAISYSVDIKDTSINVSVYLNSSAPLGTNFHGLGKIFSVEFGKLANFNAVDTVTFTVPYMLASYDTTTINKTVKPATYTSYRDSIYTGSLKYWYTNIPIAYDPATPSAHLITNVTGNLNPSIAVQPNTIGKFTYNINNGDTITIVKDIDALTNVMPIVNGYDAYLTQRVLVEEPGFTPNVYQIISMDVNMDGVVSAGDLSQINQRATLLIPEYTQVWNAAGLQQSRDMLFVSLNTVQVDLSYRISTTFPSNDGVGYSKYKVPAVPLKNALSINNYSTCPEIFNETFKGILLGDVDGNYATVAYPSVNKTTENKVIFDIVHTSSTGNYLDVPVSVVSNENVNSLDFSAVLNNSDLSFIQVNDLSNSLHMMSNMASDNTLMFTSSSLSNYTASPVSIRFYANGGTIHASDLSSIQAFVNGKVAVVEIATGVEEMSNDHDGLKVYPNPASDILNIEVSENSTVQLQDINGKQIFVSANVIANQKQSINVRNIAEGIYLLKIVNDKFTSVSKVIISK